MSANPPLVYIIVITFNGLRHLDGCFRSIRRTDYPNYRVLLVDNASADGSAEYVRSNFPEVCILRHETNLGFAAGNNRAMEVALAEGADHVFLLNDDTVILDADWLTEAVSLADRDPSVGMIGFQLLSTLPSDEEIARLPNLLTPAGCKPVPRIDGCALFMRASLLKKIGTFDEAYFAYAEEDDLEARAVRTGARLVEIDRRIYHFGGGTSKKFPREASFLEIRNALRFSIKNRGTFQTLARFFKLCDIVCSPFPLFLDPNNQSHLRARSEWSFLSNLRTFCAACWWNVRHLRETLAARRQDRAREGTPSSCCSSTGRRVWPAHEHESPLHPVDRCASGISQPHDAAPALRAPVPAGRGMGNQGVVPALRCSARGCGAYFLSCAAMARAV
jgi:GT2 family glycosyltransferase